MRRSGCRTPRCPNPAGHGLHGTFCEPCATRLGRLRVEVEGEPWRSKKLSSDGLAAINHASESLPPRVRP